MNEARNYHSVNEEGEGSKLVISTAIMEVEIPKETKEEYLKGLKLSMSTEVSSYH